MATKRKGTSGKAAATAVAFLGCGLLCGCIQQYVTVDRTVVPAFDYSFIETIAVVEFTNRSACHHAGRTVADRIEGLLVNESPYRVVPRQVLAERYLVRGPRIDSKTTEKIRRVAGVDAIVIGTVEAYEFEETKLRTGIGDFLFHGSRGPKVARKASVVLYIKVVKAETGQVVWSKSTSGQVNWTGWKDPRSPTAESRFTDKALDEALREVKSLFPHKEKVREPAM